MTAIWIGYAATGVAAGFLGGLLGIGGGLVVVPALIVLFHLQGFGPELALPLALGTSLATILFTSGSSLWAHHRRAAVDWTLARRIVPGLVTGSLVGTLAAAMIPATGLKLLFVGYAVWAALRMMRAAATTAPRGGMPAPAGLAAASGLIGGVAAMTGTGAASTAIPFMVAHRVPMRIAIGTSAALGLPVAIAGTVGYALQGLARMDLPAGCVGLVYLPAVAAIAALSLLTVPAGAWLSHRLPVPVLRRSFAVVLLVVAVRTLWSA